MNIEFGPEGWYAEYSEHHIKGIQIGIQSIIRVFRYGIQSIQIWYSEYSDWVFRVFSKYSDSRYSEYSDNSEYADSTYSKYSDRQGPQCLLL